MGGDLAYGNCCVLAAKRAAAAIVGVADAVDPSGQLDGSVRGLEGQMIRSALDDAGLSRQDVDGIGINNSAGWF